MDTIKITLQICLAYGYVRLLTELIQGPEILISLTYLVGLVISAHGLLWWRNRQAADSLSGVLANPDLPIFFVVLITIAMLADAGTLVIGL